MFNRYYGILVVENKNNTINPETENFDATFADPTPYNEKGDKSYYIAAGWSEMENLPTEFELGDERRTSAIRNGVEEEYFNAELSPSTDYCYYILAHYVSAAANVRTPRASFLYNLFLLFFN